MSYLIKLTACLLIGAFLLAGCKMTLHKDYRFETLELDLGWSILHAKLRGKPNKIRNDLSVTGSPYELLVWFSAKDDKTIKDCALFLDNVSLVSSETGRIVLNIDNSKTLFRKKSDGSYSASFMFKDIELKYVDYRLLLTYHSSQECSSIHAVSSEELVFPRDYQERKVSFWDSLMGI